VHDKELLAIKRALEKWTHVLQGQRKFLVITDNSAITFMKTVAQLKGRQARWAEFFSGFNFDIQHRPGKENVVADGLSRQFAMISEVDSSNWLDKVRELSKRMPQEGFEVRDGLLYKDDKIYIPRYRDIIRLILQEYHDNPLGGHFGIAKTTEAVKRTYYWEKMNQDVKAYVQSCDYCQRNKTNKQKPYGMLKPIAPPPTRFHTYSMDFIGPLPKTKDGYDGILTIVEMLTKYTILEPIKMTYGAPDVAKVFFRRVVTIFGMPRKIISDRDPRFTGNFWKTLFGLTQTKLAMSTAFHPQTDGQTERMNQTAEQILRNYVNYYQDNWNEYLPCVQFVMNNNVNTSTKEIPARLVFAHVPQLPVDMIMDKQVNNPTVEQFIDSMTQAVKRATDNIVTAQIGHKKNFDRHRRLHQFQVGDWVLLNNANFNVDNQFRGGSRKLRPRYDGPFQIVEKKGEDTFRLQLPENWRIHDVFDVSKLKLYIPNDDELFPERDQKPPEPVIVDDGEEFEVEEIVDVKMRHRKKQYLVKWKGYPEYENTWEPLRNLPNAREAIREFEQKQKGDVRMTEDDDGCLQLFLMTTLNDIEKAVRNDEGHVGPTSIKTRGERRSKQQFSNISHKHNNTKHFKHSKQKQMAQVQVDNYGFYALLDEQANCLWQEEAATVNRKNLGCAYCKSKYHIKAKCKKLQKKNEKKSYPNTIKVQEQKAKDEGKTERTNEAMTEKYFNLVTKQAILDKEYPEWNKIFYLSDVINGEIERKWSNYVVIENELDWITNQAKEIFPTNNRHSYMEAYYNYVLWKGRCVHGTKFWHAENFCIQCAIHVEKLSTVWESERPKVQEVVEVKKEEGWDYDPEEPFANPFEWEVPQQEERKREWSWEISDENRIEETADFLARARTQKDEEWLWREVYGSDVGDDEVSQLETIKEEEEW